MTDDLPLSLAPGVRIRFRQRAGRRELHIDAPHLRAPVVLDAGGAIVVEHINGVRSLRDLRALDAWDTEEQRHQVRGWVAHLVAKRLVRVHQGIQVLEDHARQRAAWAERWGQLQTVQVAALGPDELELLSHHVPTSDCERCQLHCCNFSISVGRPEVPRLCRATVARDFRPRDLFQPPNAQAHLGIGLVTLRRGDDGTCVLLDQGRCIAHSTSGPRAKPLACQLFPGIPVLTPDGARLGIRPSCPHGAQTKEASARRAFASTLQQMQAETPNLILRRAPKTVIPRDGVGPTDWAHYMDWETEALRAAATCEDGLSALDACIRHAAERWGATDAQRGLAERIQRGLGGLLASSEATLASVLTAPTRPHKRAWVSVDQVTNLLRALEPLRFKTLLAGLGVCRLIVVSASEDIASPMTPRERFAAWFRAMDRSEVRSTLARAGVRRLEALAFAGSYEPATSP